MVTVIPVRIGSRHTVFLTGLVALLIGSLGAILGGMFLGTQSETLKLIPGLIVLLPPSINMRGSVAGVLASRLSSSMHLGAFEIDFRKNTVLGDNIRASLVSTVIIAFVLGFFVRLVGSLLGMPVIGIADLIVISVVSGIISGLIVIIVTVIVSVASYRLGLDLDLIAAPTVTTAADLVTLPILVVTAIELTALGPTVIEPLFWAIIIVVTGSIVYSRLNTAQVRIIVRELIPLLIPLSLVGTFAGIVYQLELEKITYFAAFLILIPPFAGGCGSIGGILCSRLATGMHMGIISPEIVPQRDVLKNFMSTYTYSLILLPLLAVLAHEGSLLLALQSPGLAEIILITVSAGLIVMSLVNFISYITASLSFRYGFDPDNFGIPVITSTIDFIGALVLVAVINIVV